jgi:HEAT repeat protein
MKAVVNALLLVAFVAGYCGAQAPPTIEQALKTKGVDTSQRSLLKALHSSNVEVRGLAAMQLAEEDDKSSAPALREALRNERDSSARLNIARALNRLGDEKGTEAMTDICSDASVPADLRLMAANEISPREGERCFGLVVQTLHSDNPAEVQAALNYLNSVASTMPATTREQNLLSDGLARAIQNSVPSVRQGAAACIGKYNVVDARAVLLEAEAKETDSNAKAAMHKALQQLAP